jgi:ornithine cyclodeaminase
MRATIDAVARAYMDLSLGRTQSPLRARLHSNEVGGVSLIMPALLESSGAAAVKIVSVFPQNPASDLPTIHAAVLVIDSQTGEIRALLEGGSLTAIRTGAGSGAATRALAREEASTVAILGAGVQARTQLEAMCTVRAIKKGWIFDRTTGSARSLIDEMAGQGSVPADLSVADSAEAAVANADVVCTATTSSTPVFPGIALRPGSHVNAVGSFMPEMEEVDLDVLKRARIFVDSREAALDEAGDLLGPIRRGELSPDAILAEIGEVLAGKTEGRTDGEQITYFKSVGVAVQDAAAAALALANAESAGLGQLLHL